MQWAILSFNHKTPLHYFLSILERQVLGGPGWKIPEFHQKFSYSSLLTKQHPFSFSLIFSLQTFPSSLKSTNPNIVESNSNRKPPFPKLWSSYFLKWIKRKLGLRWKINIILLFSLFLLLFIGFMVHFSTIYEPHCTILIGRKWIIILNSTKSIFNHLWQKEQTLMYALNKERFCYSFSPTKKKGSVIYIDLCYHIMFLIVNVILSSLVFFAKD